MSQIFECKKNPDAASEIQWLIDQDPITSIVLENGGVRVSADVSIPKRFVASNGHLPMYFVNVK